MLNPEVAEKRLEEFQLKKSETRRSDRVRGLDEPQRTAAYGLLARRPDGKAVSAWDQRQKTQRDAAALLTSLTPEQRRPVWEALFPQLAAHMEAGWRLHARLPYQIGEERRGFRVPDCETALIDTRLAWLEGLLSVLERYEQPVTWIAAWAPYLEAWQEPFGPLLAGAIDTGGAEGEAVFEILLASGRGDHEIGAMGRHVVGGLLCCSRPEAWAFVEQLLLAAQRQEGLRQVILEAVDETHPLAFRRMLRLMLEHDLLRFSSAVRAVDVWYGLQLDALTPAAVRKVVSQVLTYLEGPEARAEALRGDDLQAVYLALCAAAVDDARAAIADARPLLGEAAVERRFIAARFLQQVDLPESRAALLPALEDTDLRVALTALEAVVPETYYGATPREVPPDFFERLEALLVRTPKKTTLPPLVWPWMTVTADRQVVAGALLVALGSRSPKRLIPHLAAMEVWKRREAVDLLTKARGKDPEIRQTLFALAGDTSETVREAALTALAKLTVSSSEAQGLEGLLTRQSADLRRGVLSLLLNQPDEAALASADRLTARSNAQQRLAGLEILQQLWEKSRSGDECRARAAAYRERRTELSDQEQTLLDGLQETRTETVSLDDALGLMDPSQRTQVELPQPVPGVMRESPAATELIRSLDALVHRNRETSVRIPGWNEDDPEQGAWEELLGNLNWGFPAPNAGQPLEKDLHRLPLRDLWETWWAERPAVTRDADGFELIRAQTMVESTKRLKYPRILASALKWLLRLHPTPGAEEFLLDAVQDGMAAIPAAVVVSKLKEEWDDGWRGEDKYSCWLELCGVYRSYHGANWTPDQFARYWRLLRWWDEPLVAAPNASHPGETLRAQGRMRPSLEDTLAAWKAGAATEADLLDRLLGSQEDECGWAHGHDLHRLTGRKPSPFFAEYPGLSEVVDRCRERVLEVELRRGDLPTAASTAALAIRAAGGLETLVGLLQALGKTGLVRGWISNDQGRAPVFSHLIRTTFPGPEDTPAAFAQRVREARIAEKRLVEIAFYAPQWAAHVEAALGWPQLAEAVWWVHAHTKDDQWSVDEEIRESWAAQMGERTPLTAQNLIDGAVDVDWFHRVYAALGAERWGLVLNDGAKYASGGGGHKRAQLFAEAMLGLADRAALVTRIAEKRHGDSLRALGLLPLPENAEEREAEVLARYETAQEFIRTSRQFGAMRQASEKLAASVCLENLARTAGYADPVRLEWAMEARAIADLAAGPVVVTHDDVTVTLSVDQWGSPDITIARAGKTLKAVPPAAKKEPAVAALLARKTEVERQSKRMRASLEAAMCRGDAFTPAELRDLFGHPVLAPMLRNLVFVADSTPGEALPGYPIDEGWALEAHDGTVHGIAPDHHLRIAHPHDLLRTGAWDRWQHDCFHRERIQPFKQVFRELYLLTEAEQQEGGHKSARYTGHQVQPKQSRALLGRRGWVSNPEEGEIRRTFHADGLTAWLVLDEGISTPAEVEGLTIGCVGFSRRGDWNALPLSEVPPRLFSEVMRDIDLVVSVAHVGGVDPEATQSTVEMRAVLLQETLDLLRITNVHLKDRYAFVDGKLGSYTIHLGSAVVHRQPGGHLCIVPVPSQHRGRLFLPFADNDPRTAEVVSKVLLLAKDDEIKDPTILEQILKR